MADHHVPGIGEPHPSPQTDEQVLADGRLESGDLLRDRPGRIGQEGRRRYEEAIARIEATRTDGTMDARNEAAAAVWREYFPDSERGLHRDGLAYFTYAVPADRPAAEPPADADVEELLSGGWLVAEPIVYEDFLPRSAAGIFSSNLVEAGAKNGEHDGAGYDLARLSTLIGRPIADPDELYRQQSQTSLNAATDALGLRRTTPTPAPTVAHI
ncbi:2-oxoadipate dioxygenase/decarboxylase family protein [Gordonia sp. (in: high G+C Gram-positive bacteria)]|uniref:2-oxoadipate dioxygenase/decarboxylase family protein n=1 Tax=Gordonia sp. (in: high G+C Gram-positive bacteria) TaxID=84139 RepID=UPI003C77DACA